MSDTIKSIIHWIGLFTLVVMLVKPIDAAVFQIWSFSRDSTDSTGERSGLSLKTDFGTGCQYLVSPWGGITARLDGNGKHICTSPAQ